MPPGGEPHPGEDPTGGQATRKSQIFPGEWGTRHQLQDQHSALVSEVKAQPMSLSNGQRRPEVTEAQAHASWAQEGQKDQDTESRQLHDHQIPPASPGMSPGLTWDPAASPGPLLCCFRSAQERS